MSQPQQSIAEQLIHTTVIIFTHNKDGKDYSGTGFFVDYKKDGKNIPMIVTNRHNIEGALTGSLKFLKRKDMLPVFGETQTVNYDNFEKLWTAHPDPKVDIAVFPLGGTLKQLNDEKKDIYYKQIPLDIFPTDNQINELDAIEEIIFIGYPKTIIDPVNLSPITRRGITATPIQRDFNGDPIFLIDAPVFGGSSGSPVFIFNKGWVPQKMGGVKMGDRVILLGIVTRSHYYFEEGEITVKEEETKDDATEKTRTVVDTRTFTGIGIVYKANKIMETMDHCSDKVMQTIKEKESKKS